MIIGTRWRRILVFHCLPCNVLVPEVGREVVGLVVEVFGFCFGLGLNITSLVVEVVVELCLGESC